MQHAALGNLWHISRPDQYGYLVGSFLLGAVFGIESLTDFSHPWFWILLLFFLIPANVFVHGMRYLFDAEFSVKTHTKMSPQMVQAERSLLQMVLLAIGVLTALLAVQMIFLPLALLCLFMIWSAAFSASPARLRTRPVLDSYAAGFYALPGLIGYSFFTLQLPYISIIMLIWAWLAGWYAWRALQTMPTRLAQGTTTIATMLGVKNTLVFVLFHWLVFTLVSWWWLPLPLAAITWLFPALALYARSKSSWNKQLVIASQGLIMLTGGSILGWRLWLLIFS